MLVKRSLERAATLHKVGKAEQARSLWQSVVDLYDYDPDMATFVEQARQGLSQAGDAAKP